MKTVPRRGPNQVHSSTEYSVVGTRPIRHDGTDKVTGRAIYGEDFQAAGTLYAKVLRSPHAHARVRGIDTSKAEALPGVKAVVTSKDMPDIEDKISDLGEGSFSAKWSADNILASGKVLYKGHAIVGVAATSWNVAEEALKLIEVDYEVLPAVITIDEAMSEGAPLVHEDLVTKSLGESTDTPSNVARHFQHIKGDIEKGFAEADVVVEREYTTATVHQAYIEPQNVTAHWNQDGHLTIWTSNQGAFGVREQVASVLDLPVSRIRVIPLEIGGGFGGKVTIYMEPVAALLSRKAGRPVRMLMSRAEVFQGTGPAPGSATWVKVGAKSDGTLTAAQAIIRMEAGAYPGSSVGAAAICIFAPYDVPNGQIDGYDVVLNKPKSEAYRAPGAPQAAFAGEQIMDELAEKLGMDPIEVRLKNSAKEGTRRVDGPVFPRIGAYECLVAAKEHEHYQTPLEGPNRGRGVASGFWMNGGGQSACTISINEDGSLTLVEGSTDIGGTRTSSAMQAAEILGVLAEDIRPLVADTDSIGYTGVTGGSRTTFATGWASIEAARDLLGQMCARAARIWNVDPSTVEYRDSTFRTSADASKSFEFKELGRKLFSTGGTLTGRSNVSPRGVGGAFSTQIVDVEVDPDTGKVQVLRCTVVQDAGKAIHPSYVEGQMQGGAVQGIGWALWEGYEFDKTGGMLNPSLLDYKLPTALDVPMIDTVIVEVPNPGHPFGVRGVGEVPIVPTPAATANAIARAIGARLAHLPITSYRILEATGAVEPESVS
jgi:xanthine dehydrogenase molybdenum-binding subunit